VTIPEGTTISVKLTTPIASDTSKVEDPVRGTLSRPLVVSGTTAIPAGAEVVGSVLEANESGRVKGKAALAFRFDRMIVGDERHDIRTARVTRAAASSRNSDIKKGAIGAGVGAVVGGIVGGAKGAAIGAGAGGTGAVLATKGNEVRLASGSIVTTTLQQALTVRVPLERKHASVFSPVLQYVIERLLQRDRRRPAELRANARRIAGEYWQIVRPEARGVDAHAHGDARAADQMIQHVGDRDRAA